MEVHAVKMMILFWTFTAVCVSSDDVCTISSSCPDVTGTVHEALTLTCSISINCIKEDDQCCIKMYKFKDENTKEIHRKMLSNGTCEREIKATCVFNPSKNITAKFMFFLQASCGTEEAEFTVNVTESGRPTDAFSKGETKLTTSEVIVTVLGAIVFIIMMLIVYKKYNPTIPCRLQKDYRSADSA